MTGILVFDWRERTVTNTAADPAAAQKMADAQQASREAVMAVTGVPPASGEDQDH